jgi:eukaryotic translation initiation factor 2-alpha kinase 4
VNGFSPVKSRSDDVCAVGIQISLDKIASALASFQSSSLKDSLKHHRSYGYWSPRRCDVYVAAHSSDLEGTLLERLEVTSFLWRNDISADMMYEYGGAEGENIVDQCSREGILYVSYFDWLSHLIKSFIQVSLFILVPGFNAGISLLSRSKVC